MGLSATALLLSGCSGPSKLKIATVSMYWECGLPHGFEPGPFYKLNPGNKPVTLHFVRYPNIAQIEDEPGLCDALKAAGKPVVQVVFVGTADWLSGRISGYTTRSVNGYVIDHSGPNMNLGGRAPTLNELLQ